MSKGWGALAKWAPFFDDQNDLPAGWNPLSGSGLIVPSAFQAAGDILVGTGNGTYKRLPIGGTAGDVLGVGGVDPSGLEWLPGGGALAHYSNVLAADVAVAANGSSGGYISLGALPIGTYFVSANTTFLGGVGSGYADVLLEGQNPGIPASGDAAFIVNGWGTVTLLAIVVLTAAHNVMCQYNSVTTASTIKATNEQGFGLATRMDAIKVA